MEGNEFIISKIIKWGIFLSIFTLISLYARKYKKEELKRLNEDEFAMTDEEIKQGELLAYEDGELLTEEEEKQVWKEFQDKVEENN